MPLRKLLSPPKSDFGRWLGFVLVAVACAFMVGGLQGWSPLKTLRVFSEMPVYAIGLIGITMIAGLFVINYHSRWLAMGVLYFVGLILAVEVVGAELHAQAIVGWIYHAAVLIDAIVVGILLKRRGALI